MLKYAFFLISFQRILKTILNTRNLANIYTNRITACVFCVNLGLPSIYPAFEKNKLYSNSPTNNSRYFELTNSNCKMYTSVSQKHTKLVMLTCRALLFHSNSPQIVQIKVGPSLTHLYHEF